MKQLRVVDPETDSPSTERAQAIALVRRFRAGWYELAQALTEHRRTERYKQWGYASFEDYCKRELRLQAATVAKLTGSYTYLHKKAPETLKRDGRSSPIPSYQAVDFLRRAEEESAAPAETLREIRRHVLDEGTSLPKVSRLYRQVVFPLDEGVEAGKRKGALRAAIDRLVQLVAEGKEEGTVPRALAAEVEEPLQRLAVHLADAGEAE